MAVTDNLFPNGGSLDANATYDAEQRALYNSGQPSAYTITRTTGNLIAFMSLQEAASNPNSIISLARSQDPARLLADGAPAAVVRGYKDQRNVIIGDLIAKGVPVGSISWNTGPATSIYMTRPLSRGSILISSADPLADPLIDFGAVTDPTDMEMLLEIYKKNRELMKTPEIARLGPQETSPAPGLTDDEAIKAAIRATVQPTNAHQCCTLPMINRDKGGVVDKDFKVFGTKNLSVVDASIWPFIVGGGPQATVYGNAEKVYISLWLQARKH